jgi:hypothetical protein
VDDIGRILDEKDGNLPVVRAVSKRQIGVSARARNAANRMATLLSRHGSISVNHLKMRREFFRCLASRLGLRMSEIDPYAGTPLSRAAAWPRWFGLEHVPLSC